MAACGEQGDYGKQRLWGALGWGLFSAVAGSLISRAGMAAAFGGHAALAALALLPMLRLPFGPLHAKLDGQQQARAPKGAEPAAAGAEVEVPGIVSAPSERAKGVLRFDSALEAQALLQQANAAGSKAEGHATESAPGGGHCSTSGDPPSPQHTRREQQQPPPQQQPRVRFWRGVRQLLRNPEAAIFLAQAVVMGYGVGTIEGYLFLTLDEIGERALLWAAASLPAACLAACMHSAACCIVRSTSHCLLPAALACRRLRAADGLEPERHLRSRIACLLLPSPDPPAGHPLLHPPRVCRLPAAPGAVQRAAVRTLAMDGELAGWLAGRWLAGWQQARGQ
jgi:hypothetical protein